MFCSPAHIHDCRDQLLIRKYAVTQPTMARYMHDEDDHEATNVYNLSSDYIVFVYGFEWLWETIYVSRVVVVRYRRNKRRIVDRYTRRRRRTRLSDDVGRTRRIYRTGECRILCCERRNGTTVCELDLGRRVAMRLCGGGYEESRCGSG